MGERDGQQARAEAHEQETRLAPQQQATRSQETSAAQANHMMASLLGQRVTAPVKPEHDFGEHIVGSDNNVERIHAPWNLADSFATAEINVSGEAFQLMSPGVMALQPSSKMKSDDLAYVERASPKIAFRPRRVGEFNGTLTIRLTWPMDGHVETQRIALRGRARALTDAPADFGAASTATGMSSPASPVADTLSQNDNQVATKKDLRNFGSVERAIDGAALAASSLAVAQEDGLVVAEQDARSYEKELPQAKRSKWWDLAEMALNLATGNLAATFASRVLPRLLTTGKTTEIPGVGSMEVSTTPVLSEALTGTIRAGIISAGAKAIKAALPAEKSDATPSDPQKVSGGVFSSNPGIDFFAQQRAVLHAQKDEYHAEVSRHANGVGPLITEDPEEAIRVLSVVEKLFKEMKKDAARLQIESVVPAWVSLVARLKHGEEEAAAPNNHASSPRHATRMDAVRSPDHRGDPASATAGVLDLYVSPSGEVQRAQLNGVSQEIADQLVGMPLATVAMPIRFIVGRPGEPRPTIVTRDEAGRVRVVGELGGHTQEADAVRSANELIERVLAKKLDLKIKTDDTTGRRL